MKDENIMVSILCTVYNHEKYLSKCLDNLLKQETNFKYEIIIHDDNSSDKSKNIIKQYHKKYPNIIVDIIQNENKYSKGINIYYDILAPKINGKYIAICEGDDFWCDSRKLQKQYDFMEKHLDCSLCFHNTNIFDLKKGKYIGKFNGFNDNYKMKPKDIFFGWKIHTSSYFFRKEAFFIPDKFYKYWFLDFIWLIWAYNKGNVYSCSSKIMSVYNYNNENGMTQLNKENCNIIIQKLEDRIEFLEEALINGLNDKECIKERIEFLKIDINYISLKNSKNYIEFKKYKRNILKNQYLFKYWRLLKIKSKLKFIIDIIKK